MEWEVLHAYISYSSIFRFNSFCQDDDKYSSRKQEAQRKYQVGTISNQDQIKLPTKSLGPKAILQLKNPTLTSYNSLNNFLKNCTPV
jgi:hypothetical protein